MRIQYMLLGVIHHYRKNCGNVTCHLFLPFILFTSLPLPQIPNMLFSSLPSVDHCFPVWTSFIKRKELINGPLKAKGLLSSIPNLMGYITFFSVVPHK